MRDTTVKTYTFLSGDHKVERGAQYCSCGQDAVTCQDCGKQICGNFTTWAEHIVQGHHGNRCESCMQKLARPIVGKPWIESVLPNETYVRCVECHQTRLVRVASERVILWARGALIQNAMPMHDASVRELMVSGLCGVCFDNVTAQES